MVRLKPRAPFINRKMESAQVGERMCVQASDIEAAGYVDTGPG